MVNEQDLQAKSSPGVPWYTKIDFTWLKRVATSLTTGSKRYDPHVMVENWRLGDMEFYHDRANHALEHIFKWLSGDRGEDHLAHASANLMMLSKAEELGIYSPTSPEERTHGWRMFIYAQQEAQKKTDDAQLELPLESPDAHSQGNDTQGSDSPASVPPLDHHVPDEYEVIFEETVKPGPKPLTMSFEELKRRVFSKEG